MTDLTDRVAIVTGGARGQGAVTARTLLDSGARVVIADVLENEGASLASSLGDKALFFPLNVADEAAWQQLVSEVKTHWGRIDILINNAGVVHPAGLCDLTKTDFQRVLDINLIGAWLGMKHVASIMAEQGKGAIVNICSTSALWGMNGLTAYSASKWALRGVTKTAALELGHQGIRVNSIFPGGVNTIMGNVANETPEEMAVHYQNQPIQRIGEPEEIAQITLFLVSDAASYLCGAEIAADGGMTLGGYNGFLPGAPATNA